MKKESLQRHTLKILSILLAVSLWFYVLNSGPVEIEKKLPINFKLPQGMAMVNFSEKEVILKIRGPKAFIANVFSNKEKYTVDLNPYYQTNGKSFRVKFYASSIEVPFGVEILDISPKETLVELDQKGMTELPVKVQFIGDLNKDRKLKEFHLNPPAIVVSGPIEILKKMNKVDTAPLNLLMLNKDEGTIILKTAPIDPRLNLDESVNLKFQYKTKKILSFE